MPLSNPTSRLSFGPVSSADAREVLEGRDRRADRGVLGTSDRRRPLGTQSRALVVLAVFAMLAAGCGAAEEREADPRVGWVADPERPLPAFLSETGIYSELSTFAPGGGAIAYVPAHPLWSNGADKDRLLFLPPAARIDPAGPAWEFPTATVLVKSFLFEDLEGRDGPVGIETRVLARRREGWLYALYHWNAQGTEAALVGSDWRAERLQLEDASGAVFDYTLPGKLDCRSCHETPGTTPVLGIARWQQPEALADLADALFSSPPPDAALSAVTDSPEESAAMSYVLGNCAFCHNGRDTGENASFSLEPPDFRENTLNRETDSSASGIGLRIVPGDVDASAVYEAVVATRRPAYRGDFKPMPPIGIDRLDPRAEQILRRYIESLEPELDL